MIFMAFIFGIIMGSFLNVCIYRLPLGKSVVSPGSFCPHCKHKIKWQHNIPVLSYVFLKGRCAYCSKKISPRYLFVELLSGAITAFSFLKFGFSAEFFFYLALLYSLIVISFIDFDVHLILNKILIALILIALAFNVQFKIIEWQNGLIGLLTGGGLLLFFAFLGKALFKKESMGMGDVKLAAVLGFFLGWEQVLVVLYSGFVLALFYFGIKHVFKTAKKSNYIPMAPFFSLAAMLFIFYGEQLWRVYLRYFM